VPARGIGRTTVEQAEKFAARTAEPVGRDRAHARRENQFGTRAHSAPWRRSATDRRSREAVATMPLNDALAFIEDRTGYRRMLEQENSPESPKRASRTWNELMNAAAEAVERGETADFLDHAALVATPMRSTSNRRSR
jgi:superfamily I DNA/RNA helicase